MTGEAGLGIADFNALDEGQALAVLRELNHSAWWGQAMLARRPFPDLAALLDAAEGVWALADEAARLDAFRGHARIGDREALRDRFSAAAREQGNQIDGADAAVIDELFHLNRAYEQRHGFLFIICASGRSASEMRDRLRERIDNDRVQELDTAAREQGAITALRIRRRFIGSGREEPR